MPRRTHCKKGHPMVDGNVIVKRRPGGQVHKRQCRTCLELAMNRPKRTHCPLGHALVRGNIAWHPDKRRKKKGRQCKTCVTAKHRAWRVLHREEYNAYHCEWNRRRRAVEYLYRAIRDNGREIAQAVFD